MGYNKIIPRSYKIESWDYNVPSDSVLIYIKFHQVLEIPASELRISDKSLLQGCRTVKIFYPFSMNIPEKNLFQSVIAIGEKPDGDILLTSPIWNPYFKQEFAKQDADIWELAENFKLLKIVLNSKTRFFDIRAKMNMNGVLWQLGVLQIKSMIAKARELAKMDGHAKHNLRQIRLMMNSFRENIF